METTVREKEIAQATTRGLQVDFAGDANTHGSEGGNQNEFENEHMNGNSNSSFKDCTRAGDAEMEEWEKEHEENALVDFEDESDDDLL